MKARDLILCALFAALTAVGGLYLKIPIPNVPITFQFFFCAMAGICLGSKLGALSQVVYVAAGLAGFPIFTKGGGPGYVLEPTFGYLLGFILCAFVIGLLTERMRELKYFKVLISAAGRAFMPVHPGRALSISHQYAAFEAGRRRVVRNILRVCHRCAGQYINGARCGGRSQKDRAHPAQKRVAADLPESRLKICIPGGSASRP